MALISIIIPCYNAEKYIDRCMQTVVHQTIGIENLEIILVNDASTDDTLDRLKAWESIYPNQILVVTYEENLRQGGARNVGMQYASADYIAFVDADDWIELSMYEKLYGILQEEDYDVVACKQIRQHSPGEPYDNRRGRDVSYHFKKIDGFYACSYTDVGDIGYRGGVCASIYRRSCIIDNACWFPEHIAYEDNFWNGVICLYVSSVYILDEILYHYYVNEGSTTEVRNSLHQLDRLKVEVMLLEEYIKRGAFSVFYGSIERRFMREYYIYGVSFIFTKFDTIPDVFETMRQTVLHYFPDYKTEIPVSEYSAVEQLVIQLLDLPNLSMEELKQIQSSFVRLYKAARVKFL